MALKRIANFEPSSKIVVSRCVGWRRLHNELCGLSLEEVYLFADLGGSSMYSAENVEDRSGEGFHVNCIWTWVKRP